MTDKKDPPPKGPDKRGNDGAGAKRPYATLDLKATEVRAASSGNADPSGDAKAAAKPSAGGAATSSSSSSPGATPGNDQSEAAARVAAAAAAVSPSRPALGATGQRATTSASGPAGAAALQPRDWSSYASHAVAGVAGGLLALIGSLTLAPSQDPRSANAELVQSLSARIAAVEQQAKQGDALPADVTKRLTGLETGVTQVADLNRAVGALREAQAKLGEQAEALRTSIAQSSDRDVAGRIDKLQEQLSALAATAAADPQSAGRIPQLAQILGKVNDLDLALNTRLATLRKDMAQEMDTRTASVSEASEAAKSGVQRLDRDVAVTRSEAARVGQRVDVLKAGTDRLDQSLRMLQGETTAIKSAIDGLEGQLKTTAKPTDVASAVAPLSAKVAAVEESLQGVVRADGDRKTAAERIVLSLELGNLKRAMDRGGAMRPSLPRCGSAAAPISTSRALERYQHDGVPLAQSWRASSGPWPTPSSTPTPSSRTPRSWIACCRVPAPIVRVRKVDACADDTSHRGHRRPHGDGTEGRPPRRVLAEGRETAAARPRIAGAGLAEEGGGAPGRRQAMADGRRPAQIVARAMHPVRRAGRAEAAMIAPCPVSRRRCRAGRRARVARRPARAMCSTGRATRSRRACSAPSCILALALGLAMLAWSMLRQIWIEPGRRRPLLQPAPPGARPRCALERHDRHRRRRPRAGHRAMPCRRARRCRTSR